jgi:hypothetical protein
MGIKSESGIALVSTLLVLVLLSALLTAFIISINSDQGLIGVDRDQNRAFYGSLAGLEKLTADIVTLFTKNYQTTTAQINALTANPPSISGISFVAPEGGSGYQVQIPLNANGTIKYTSRTISSGPYEGLSGRIASFVIITTAHTATDAEAQLSRSLQVAEVPVFQFGMYSETDLSFFAGPDFGFGGRVHTNGNLFLAEGDGKTLTLSDRVTAMGEVIRKTLSNGHNVTSSYNGAVRGITAPNSYRALATNEGSVVGALGSAQNEPTWTNLSIGTYNGNIRNGRTGARRMQLPIATAGGTPIDMLRRPAENSAENVANPNVYRERFYGNASMRILLSDTTAHITLLPTVTATAPMELRGNAPNGTVYAVPQTGAGAAGNGYRSTASSLIGGYIKIEIQTQQDVWQDVTNEILSFGIAGKPMIAGGGCVDEPNAIIRLQRFKDSPTSCGNTTATNYWPNVLYDAREGYLRDKTTNTNIYLNGVMHYVELDITNLNRWFTGALAGNGPNAMHPTGYIVYFSDRRINTSATTERAEYGYEDFVNPNDTANGLPNGILDAGEDVNGNGILDTYGQTPVLPNGASSPLDGGAGPWTSVTSAIARKNLPVLFRRALMLVHGATISLGTNSDGNPIGLTIATENPLYVKGNYNANGTFNGTHAACAWIADAVTILSGDWNDANSFSSPGDDSGRQSMSDYYYRAAVIAGKGISFPWISGNYQDFGTDGGAHNFLRFLEDWGGRALNYRGSIVSLYFSQQAVGTYKCGYSTVYDPPTRGYNFDTDFLDPNLLPPGTPNFIDVNITGFSRIVMPN